MVYAEGGSSQLVDTPEQKRIHFVLSDDEVLTLARWAAAIEDHYGRPMDIEWAKDGETSELFIVQARPETVQSRKGEGTLKSYSVKSKGKRLLTGASIGSAVATGKVRALASPEDAGEFPEGAILVTGQTDPDWVPIMNSSGEIIASTNGSPRKPSASEAIVMPNWFAER